MFDLKTGKEEFTVTFVTVVGDSYNFYRKGKNIWWDSYKTPLSIQTGKVLKVFDIRIGEPLRFLYEANDGEIYYVETAPIRAYHIL